MMNRNQKFEKNDLLCRAIEEHINLFNKIKKEKILQEKCLKVAKKLVHIYKNKGKVLLCGNGGSAAQSQHLAAELVGRFYLNRKALNAVAMTANESVLSAIANDFNFDQIFSRQIEAKGQSGDMLIALSTSGRSKNIIEAVKTSHKIKIFTVVLTGQNHLPSLSEYADIIIRIPSKNIPRIQEAHLFIGHFICEYVEKELFSKR